MIHETRVFCVSPVDSAEELAENLTRHTWTLCTGFELGGYLFLNDSFSEDGAGEFTVVKRPAQEGEPFTQVESITFSWCSKEEALGYIRQALAGEFDRLDFVRPVGVRLETPEEHGSCHLCM